MQQAFHENHGLQCGFCTPGMIMAAVDMVRRLGPQLDEETIRALDAVPCDEGVTVQLLTERDRFSPFKAFVEAADRRLLSNPAYLDELLEWIRFSPNETARTSDAMFT